MKFGKIGCALLVVASCAGARDAVASTLHVEDLTKGSCAAEAAWLGCPAQMPEVPEPASLVLLGSGLFAIGSRFKRARSRS